MKGKTNRAKRRSATTPRGEGERRAQRGYVSQYRESAAAIYAALERDDLDWIGVADRGAGIADDLVLGCRGRVVGHQFKNSRFPESFRLRTLLLGAQGCLGALTRSWAALKRGFPTENVEVWFVTNDYPATTDKLTKKNKSHSAAFVSEFATNPSRTLAEWRKTLWGSFVEELRNESGLDETTFEDFLKGLRLITGEFSDFMRIHGLSPEAQRSAQEIASLLPRLVADRRDQDRWSRLELLAELGWRDSFGLHFLHQFPIGAYVQRNVKTEKRLRAAIDKADSGYLALVGPPGSGKSTLLQSAVIARPDLVTVRYLAFVPGAGQGLGRGEAERFLDDITTVRLRIEESQLVRQIEDLRYADQLCKSLLQRHFLEQCYREDL